MFKVLFCRFAMVLVALVSLQAQVEAQVLATEVVELGSIKVLKDSDDRYKQYSTLVRNGCGLKGIAFGQKNFGRFDLKGFTISYQHGAAKDVFREYAMLRVGKQTEWYVLREKAPCVTKVIINGEANVTGRGPNMELIVWGIR